MAPLIPFNEALKNLSEAIKKAPEVRNAPIATFNIALLVISVLVKRLGGEVILTEQDVDNIARHSLVEDVPAGSTDLHLKVFQPGTMN